MVACGAPSGTAAPTGGLSSGATAYPAASTPSTAAPSVIVPPTAPPAETPSLTPAPSPSPRPRPHLGTTDGCRPAFWARPRNFQLWEEYQPGELVREVFFELEEYGPLTLVDALRPTGGEEDARRVLLREAAAAILNGAHESLGYPYSRHETGVEGRLPIVPTVNGLFRDGTAEQIEAFTQDLAAANQLSCPLR